MVARVKIQHCLPSQEEVEREAAEQEKEREQDEEKLKANELQDPDIMMRTIN